MSALFCSSTKQCLLLAFLVVCLTAKCKGQTTNSIPPSVVAFINEQENVTRRIAERARDLHDRRVQLVRNCSCSISSCSNEFITDDCVEFFGTPDICSVPGRLLNVTNSIVRVPPGENPDSLRDSVKENTCVYKGLDTEFLQLWPREQAWMYFGTRDGHFRRFPASGDLQRSEDADQRRCSLFDPRARPWYIAASTGPKDIVIVVDKSESMDDVIGIGQRSKWDLTKQATKDILETFNFADFINVVTFSTDAEPLWKDYNLASGIAENRKRIDAALDDEFPKGRTNFTAAFTTAFELLGNCSVEPKTCSNCQKIILFLTDGMDNTGQSEASIKPSRMAAIIDDLQEDLKTKTGARASIFTYSMTSLADDNIPRQIACANDGAWSFIGPNTDVLNAMNSYYLYIADSRRSTDPVWVEPFEDFGGLGLITTVSLPVYSTGTDKVRGVFLGVAGHDVRLSEFRRDGVDDTQVLNEIIDRSEACTGLANTACDLQIIRKSQDDKSVCPDPYPIERPTRNEPTPLCYAYEQSFYKRVSEEVSWNMAVTKCEEDGGQLVVIRDENELAFVANLADADGSWIGANSPSPNIYSWIDQTVGNITRNSTYWAVGEPASDGSLKACVSLDRRGVIGNMDLRLCSNPQSFICKYDNDDACPQIGRFPRNQNYFAVPPVSECSFDEIEEDALPIPDSRNLESGDIICDLGLEQNFQDTVCCPSDKNGDGAAISPFLSTTLLYPLISFCLQFLLG